MLWIVPLEKLTVVAFDLAVTVRQTDTEIAQI